VTSSTLTGRAAAARVVLPSPAAAAFLGAGAAATAVYFLLPPNAQSIAFVVVGLVCACTIYLGATRNASGADRLPWYLFSLGIMLEVAGDAIFAFYEIRLDREPPAPSVADAFYLAGYPVLALGFFLLLRRLGGQTSRAAMLDTIIIGVGVGIVQWVFFVDPFEHMGLDRAERVVDMAYPAVDILLLVALAQLLVGPGRKTPAYRLLLASLGLWVVADEIYALNVTSYQGGDWVDALWLLSYVAWAAAALEPSMVRLAEADRRAVPRLTTARLVLLSAALLTAPAVIAVERFAHHRVHALFAAAGSAVIAVLVLLRLAGLVRSVERARRDERHARRDAEFAQRLLVVQNEQLRELDRVKDEFLSSISHELRTPLTSISGYVELLHEDITDEDARAHLQVVERNAERLLTLVNDLLFAARLQSGRLELELEPVDLCALVEESVEAARPRAEAAQVDLVVTSKAVPLVSGERIRLEQVIDNLVSNAIKFTPAHGHVEIDVGARNGVVCVAVSDTGIGITEAERAHLFERFFRSQAALEKQIQGTGLGLYISKAIVEAHGGQIGVRSEEGKGTTFMIELPAAAEAAS
jgi:signal transduction histidine kinase